MTKKQIKNTGQVEQYYVKDDHEPIVSKELWDIVQQELARRKQFMEKHGLRTMGRYTDRQPFTNRVYCGVCGDGFWRRRQARLDCVKYQWKCKNKCMGKQGVGCSNESVWEPDLHRAFVTAWNAMLERRAEFLPNWERQAQGNDQLAAFRAKQFMQLTEDAAPLKEVDLTLVGKVLEHCEVHPLGIMKFFFLDGTQIDICINE
jgi:hypothetical protein